MIDDLKKFVFHPKNARIIYDFAASSITCFIISFMLLTKSVPVKNPYALVLLPITYTIIIYLYGIYGNLRFVSLLKKLTVISFAGVTTLAFMYIFKVDVFVSALVLIFSVILSSVARWFTNLPHQRIESGIKGDLHQIG